MPCPRVLIFLLIAVVFCSSCTIHPDFPFICFRSGCVKKAFSLKPVKKKLQATLAVNKRKRNARKNKVAKETDQHYIAENDTIIEEGASVQYTKYLLQFFTDTVTSQKDSVLITYSSAQKRIMDAGESAIEHLLLIKGVNNIQYVTFRQARFDQAGKSDSQASDVVREKKIRNFLHMNGIPRARVEYLDK